MRPLFRVLLTTVLVCGLAAAVTSALRAQAPAGEPRIWQGIYAAAQAERGKITYTSTCLRCHGADLMGVTAPALTGDRFYSTWGGEPVDRLFIKIRDTMPPTFSTSAIDDKTKLEIVTYILQTNGFPAGATDLAGGAEAMSTAAILK
jgi:polar amino acid transport system substrate-binding protein